MFQSINHFWIKKLSVTLTAVFFQLLFTVPASALVFSNIETAADLQDALNTAANNGEDDIIELSENTVYSTADNGNSFTYIAQEDMSLLIRGASGAVILATDGSTFGLVVDTTNIASDENTHIGLEEGIQFSCDTLVPLDTSGASLLVEEAAVSVLNNSFEGCGVGVITTRLPGEAPTNYSGNYFLRNGIGAFVNGGKEINVTNNIFELNGPSSQDIFSGGGLFLVFPIEEEPIGIEVEVSHNDFLGNIVDFALNASSEGGNLLVDSNIMSGASREDLPNTGILANLNGQRAVFVNNLIVDHFADEFPFIPEDSHVAAGATIGVIGAEIILTNNTIANNQVEGGNLFTKGGLSIQDLSSDDATDPSSVELNNNIIYGNVSPGPGQDIFLGDNFPVGDTTGFPAVLRNNNFTNFASHCQDDPECTPDITEANNQDADPLFIDAANGDYHLSEGSPSISMADPALSETPSDDLEGTVRKPLPDQGALETLAMDDGGDDGADDGMDTGNDGVFLEGSGCTLNSSSSTFYGLFSLVTLIFALGLRLRKK